MNIIDIVDNRDKVFSYCPMCGTCNLNDKGDVKPCSHLVYIGMNEEGDGPLFDKINLYSNWDPDKYEENFVHYLDNKLKLDNTYTMFVAGDRTLQSYILYKLNS